MEHDFGNVSVESVGIPCGQGTISGKLYIPKSASKENPAPAVLGIHGYQNDKDTTGGYAIELARRGFVVLTIDAFGHGYTSIGLREKGFDTSIKGPNRYKMFMSFSKLNGDIEGVKDSSLGGNAAYKYLKGQDFVDNKRIGLTGHSLGTWSVWTVAKENPDHAAIVVQCGEAKGPVYDDRGGIIYKNAMLVQALYDEFDYFRDYSLTVAALNERENRYGNFGGLETGPMEWNTTYGSFEDGSARRMTLNKR